MASSIGSLVIELAANTARLSGDLGRGVSMIQNFASKAKSVVGLLGVGAGGGLFASIAKQAITLGDELQKGAQRAGISAGRFSELAAAAKQADVDITTLSKGLRNLQNAISEAASGNKAAADAFYELGLSVENLRSLSADQQLLAISKALEAIPNQTDKVRLGTAALGKAYQELVPLINEGASGISRLVEEQKKLGATFSDEQIKKLADTDDAIKRMKASWEGLATTLTAQVAPALTAVFDALAKPQSLEGRRRDAEFRLRFLPENAAGNREERQRVLAELEDIRRQERLAEIDRRPTFNRGAIGPNALAEFRRQELAAREAREKAQKEFDAYYKSLQPPRTVGFNFATENKNIHVVTEEDLQGAERAYEGAFKEIHRLANEQFESISQDIKKQTEQWSVYADQAARNMQSAFADFLFDPLHKGFKGLVQDFANVIRRMIAEAAAAKIFSSKSNGGLGLGDIVNGIFGLGNSSGGGSSGISSNIVQGENSWMSKIFKWGGAAWGSIFGGARAGGGSVSAGKAYLVGEKGPELFMPGQSGAIAPNGAGVSIVIRNSYDLRGSTQDSMAALPAVLDRRDAALKQDIISGIQRGKYPIRRNG